MATTAATLTQRARRFMGDYPDNDVLTASVASGGTALTVADGTLYGQGFGVQIDTEALYVSAAGTGTTVPVRRGLKGTTAASHASGATVLIRPNFFDIEYLDALNAGINATFPLLYQPVSDESITTVAGTYEYSVPNLNGVPIPIIYRVQFKQTGDLTFRQFRDWDIIRAGAAPFIKLRRSFPTGTLRLLGYGPIPQLTSLADSLSALYPANAEDALTMFAAQFLLASGEARRVRVDVGARDDREAANRVGGSMAAASGIYQRFQVRLMQSAMPPLPRNVKRTL